MSWKIGQKNGLSHLTVIAFIVLKKCIGAYKPEGSLRVSDHWNFGEMVNIVRPLNQSLVGLYVDLKWQISLD